MCLFSRFVKIAFLWVALMRVDASTFVTFETSVGRMELELFDEDKPVTVANFIKYATSDRFRNQFIQRWEPNFVIQGGGYVIKNGVTNSTIVTVPTFPQITNEYSVGRTFSNTYGTIAMARQAGGTNSATSQWFLSLTNNSFLDRVDGGFTVFGRVIEGTNVLNKFIPPPPTNGIYRVNIGGALNTLPALAASPSFTDLIYVDLKLKRDMQLAINPSRPGQRRISWNTVAGVTNVLEYTSVTNLTAWTTRTNFIGTGTSFGITDSSSDTNRIYRVKLYY